MNTCSILCLPGVCYMPGAQHFMPINAFDPHDTPGSVYLDYSHFIDKETKAKLKETSCSRIQS